MRNRAILFAVLMFSAFTPVCGQNENEFNEMVNTSLSSFLKEKKEYVEKGILVHDYFDELYILRDNLPLNFVFSDSITASELEIAYINEIPSKKISKKDGVLGIAYSCFILNDNKITLFFQVYHITKRKKLINISVGNATSFIYRYCCEKKKWELIETK